MALQFIIFLYTMASNGSTDNDRSSLEFTTPTSESSPSSLPTPTPVHETVHRWSSYQMGYTPDNKHSKRAAFISPNTKEKIDDIHHYQQQQMDLQRELYFEQNVMARRLSFLEQIATKFCSSKAKDVHEPMPVPCSSLDPSASYRNPWDPPPRNYASTSWTPWEQSPQRPPISPNTMTRANVWSLLQPSNEEHNDDQEKYKTPKKIIFISSSSK